MLRRTSGSLSAWIVFCGSLVFYASSLAPGIELWDTGEMQTDANALFVAHPTGFPLFIMGGWLFAHVLGAGDPAWRISLFCAIAVAIAAAMLALAVFDLTQDALASVASGLAFAPVSTVWLWAVRADVHDLALAFVAIAIVLAMRARLRPCALAWGAGLATHPVALFAFPTLLLLGWPALAMVRLRERATIALCALAPLACYAYVPLRSSIIERFGLDSNVALGLEGSALVDDGAPSSLASLAHYLFATRFAPGEAVARFAQSAGLAHARDFAHVLAYEDYGTLALALALVGFCALAYRNRRVAIALAVLGVCGIAFAANYTIESAPERYALAALWSLSAFVGYGAWWLASSIVQKPRYVPPCAAALLALCLVPTFGGAAQRVRVRAVHGDARALARQVVAATHDGSVIVATWSFATPLAYAKYVSRTLGARRIVSGWPTDYDGFYRTWRERYGHVYFIIDGSARGVAFGRRVYAEPNDTYVLSEFVK